MPRIARLFTEEGVFHILARGNNKQNIFKDSADFNVYLNTLRNLKNEHPFKLYHYCLMGNHIHLILETNEKTQLSKFMKRLNLIYYNHYKRKYGYAGHFWQDRFKSLLIEKERYLIGCGLYIERNPLKAKLVDSPEKYPFSSFNYYAYGKKDGLLDTNPFYYDIGADDTKRQYEYRNMMFDEEPRITNALTKQLFYGTEDFIKKMENRFSVNNIRLDRGRPKRIK